MKSAAAGDNAIFDAADATLTEDWDAIRSAALGHYGQIDVFINNAGISNLGMDDPTSIEDWQTLMEVNSTSVFLGLRAIIPAMIDSGAGAIVNASLLYAILGSYGHPDTMHQKVPFGLIQKLPRLHMVLKAFA